LQARRQQLRPFGTDTGDDLACATAGTSDLREKEIMLPFPRSEMIAKEEDAFYRFGSHPNDGIGNLPFGSARRQIATHKYDAAANRLEARQQRGLQQVPKGVIKAVSQLSSVSFSAALEAPVA